MDKISSRNADEVENHMSSRSPKVVSGKEDCNLYRDNPKLRSHPIVEATEVAPNVKTSRAQYHAINLEIKSNHPLVNSTSYSLDIEGDAEDIAKSEPAELAEIPNPSPRAKGKEHTKKRGIY